MKVFRSIQGKLLLFFLLIDVVSVGVLISTVSSGAREALEKASREHLLGLARFASHNIDEQLQLRWNAMRSLASNPFMTNSVIDTLGRSEYLEPLMQRLSLPGKGSEDAELWLLDFMGRAIARNGRHQTQPGGGGSFSEASWWPEVRDGAPVARVLSEEGQTRVLFAFPVIYQRHTEGALVGRFDLSFVHTDAVREGLETVLLDGERPLVGRLPEPVIRELRARSTGSEQGNTVLIDEMFYLLVPVDGFAREHGFEWSLVLSVPAERISGPVDELRQRMLQGGVVTAVLLVLLVVWRTRALLRPLQQIHGTMRRIIGGGDLGQRINVRSSDELGAIAGTFNQMLERLELRTAELERSRDQLSLLAQITSSSPVAIIMLGMDGCIHVWNEAAERLFGWPRLDMLDTPFLERVVPEGARGYFTELIARSSGNEPVDIESTLITREAGPIPVQLTLSRILDAAGQVQGHVCIVRDLREYKRLRESLVHAEKMAAVGTLVAGLSHELNNPLGIILGFSQGLLRRTTLDEASRTALLSIETQTQRCARLVRTLMDFSRRGNNPVRERIEVRPLLECVRELASGQARRGEVYLEVVEHREADVPALEAHRPEVESALLNLIHNALDATPPGGTVSLGARVSPERDGVEVFVADTGSGIPPDVLQRIFDPFFTTKPVGQGTGLGLSIARNIVEAHGGRIHVETALGAGTLVRLWFPIASSPVRRLEASV